MYKFTTLATLTVSLAVASAAGAGDTPPSSWAWLQFAREGGVVVAPRSESRFDCPMRGKSVAWEARDTFNPAAATFGGELAILYRAEDASGEGIGERTSRIGLALSPDGVSFRRLGKPVLFPGKDGAEEWDAPGGCEDPRVCETPDGRYLMLYTMWNRKVPRLGVATSCDLLKWTKHGPAFSGRFRDLATKSASVVCERKGDSLVATHKTPFGEVRAGWHRVNGKVEFICTVPDGVDVRIESSDATVCPVPRPVQTSCEESATRRVRDNFVRVIQEGADSEVVASILSVGGALDSSDSTAKAMLGLLPPSIEKVESLIASQRDDGSWQDVDYHSQEKSRWDAYRHLENMELIARSPRNERTIKAFCKAISFWLHGKFRSVNWWWNEIGAPLELGSVALLMDDALSDVERARTVEAMRESKIGMTGQNRVWLAECVMMRALLERNEADLLAARDAILSEIAISSAEEGIQDDWSFHQHGNQAQFGNYGAAYMLAIPRVAAIFAGTGLDFPDEKLSILEKLADRGFRPAVWRGAMDVGSLGRLLTPDAARAKGLVPFVSAWWLARSGRDESKRIFRDCLADMRGEEAEQPCTGLRWFPKSAMGFYRAPKWMSSVKCGTASIKGAEHVNEDNRLGAHLEDGALFTYVTGDEYRDVFPLWNWRHIPGITSYDVAEVDWANRNMADCCTRLGNTVSFCLDRAGLKARTDWSFSDDGVEVVVSGIESEIDLPVVTTVEQSIAQPNAAWKRENGGITAVNGAVVYELPSNAIVKVEERAGSWAKNMGTLSEEEVKGRVFEIVIPHGCKPSGCTCSWRVRPGVVDCNIS